jgi:RNA polymerase sigma-70 factor (ECF subfamily)
MRASEERLRGLLVRGLDGDADAYREFLKDLSAHLRAFLRRRLSHLPDDVEDLVQESLVAIHTQRHTYDAGQPLTAWVHAIAKYKLVDLMRRRASRDLLTEPLDDEHDVFSSADADAAEARRDIGKLLEQLPDRQRLPIVCMKLQGLSVVETARITGMSASAVKVGVHRGLKALAAKIRGRRMKTDDLVTMLATGAGAVNPNAAIHRYVTAIGWGAFGATLLMAILLGVRHDLAEAVVQPMFWIKLGYVVCLALASLFALSRLARPGVSLAGVVLVLAAPVLLMWTLAAIELTGADPAERRDLLFGRTWASCPLLIATLSVPTFVAMIWAVKGLAPTRLRLAGAAMGLASGGIGAVVYSLHCPEMEAPFLGSWYLVGLLIPTAMGMLLGPRLLRW